jgi:hypothetical protein
MLAAGTSTFLAGFAASAVDFDPPALAIATTLTVAITATEMAIRRTFFKRKPSSLSAEAASAQA